MDQNIESLKEGEIIDPFYCDTDLQFNVPYQEYDAMPGVRSSALKHMSRSAAHMKYWMDNRQKETEALRFGKLFHAALLEPTLFREKMVIMPKFDRRTKVGKEGHEFFMLTNQDRMILDEDDAVAITGMLNALLGHDFAAQLLSEGVREACAQWIDPETKLPCKGRFDFITKDVELVDIKSTTDAHPDEFERQIFSKNCRYDLQAGHYTSYGAATGKVRDNVFIIIGVEKKAPYGICVKILDHHALAIAEATRRRLIKGIKQCIDNNHWPCYPPGATMAIPPRWVIDQEEE